VHPCGDGAGDMRIALFGVVVGDGSGGEANSAAIWRCAMLDHFQHGCRRGVVTPEEAGEEGIVLKAGLCPPCCLSNALANFHASKCGWVCGDDLLRLMTWDRSAEPHERYKWNIIVVE